MNCIRECHISKKDRSTGECFIAVSSQIVFLIRCVIFRKLKVDQKHTKRVVAHHDRD